MAGRTLAIGDIHGCHVALAALVRLLKLSRHDTLIVLGDVIDRGPDSRNVVEQLLALSSICQVVTLRGDHEEMLLEACTDTDKMARWLGNGGNETMESYGWIPGVRHPVIEDYIPPAHMEFFRNSRDFYEVDKHIFVHAGYVADLPMESQPPLAMRWRVASASACEPHVSGKNVIVGHTAQRSGRVLDLGFLICLDTNCARGGFLTAMDVNAGTVWQVDKAGRIRG